MTYKNVYGKIRVDRDVRRKSTTMAIDYDLALTANSAEMGINKKYSTTTAPVGFLTICLLFSYG